jgi:hypothetical protein
MSTDGAVATSCKYAEWQVMARHVPAGAETGAQS